MFTSIGQTSFHQSLATDRNIFIIPCCNSIYSGRLEGIIVKSPRAYPSMQADAAEFT